MKRQIGKLILLALLTLCFVASVCVLGACDDPASSTATYTVTVKTDANTAASGVSVSIKKGGATFGDAKITDANGKASFELAPDSYTVALSNLPAGYSVPADADLALTADKHDVTVILAKDFVYTVKLVNPDNSPYYAAGVTVGVCTLEGTCLEPVALGTDGVAVISADAGDYHVKVNDLPELSAIAVDSDGYYAGANFSAVSNEMTIKVYTAIVVNAGTEMTTDEKETYFNAYYAGDDDGVPAGLIQRAAYKVSKQLAAGETAYFAVKADLKGVHTVYRSYTDGLIYLPIGDTLDLANNGHFFNGLLDCEADSYYFFKVSNEDETAAITEFVVSIPASSYITKSGAGVNDNLTVGKKGANAIIDFTANEAGKYTVTVTGANSIISAGLDKPDEFLAEEEAYGNATYDFYVLTSKANAVSYYIAVAAEAASYPATFNVKVEKTGEVEDVRTIKQVSGTLTQYENAPADKELVGVPLSWNAIVKNTSDGYYHYQSVDGPVVVVMLTEPLPKERFNDSASGARLTVAYGEESNFDWNIRYVCYTEKGDGKGELIDDWQMLLRGFDKDDIVQNGSGLFSHPDHSALSGEYYAKYVNSDGVYPLTQDLLDFLVDFESINSELFGKTLPAISAADRMNRTGAPCLFPCFYYADKQQDSGIDEIVGEYKFVSITENGTTYNVGSDYNDYVLGSATTEGKLTADSAKLVINEDGTVDVMKYDNPSSDYIVDVSGSVVKSGNGYTFTLDYGCTLVYSNGVFTFVDGETQIVYGAASSNPDDGDADPIVGVYVDGDNELVVSKNGDFAIYDTFGGGHFEMDSGSWVKVSDGNYTFTVPDGQPDPSDPMSGAWVDLVYAVAYDSATKTLTFVDDGNTEYEFVLAE